ncbi:MAG: hypothetical protein EBU33_01205 [Sphingobacteriia bacterium]|nr:hypothetical protein [Sphingobacteriia bacterium]
MFFYHQVAVWVRAIFWGIVRLFKFILSLLLPSFFFESYFLFYIPRLWSLGLKILAKKNPLI